MKAVRISLLVLIIIGLGLIFTQNLWVSTVVNWIIKNDSKPIITVATTPDKKEINKPASDCVGLCIPFDSRIYIKNEEGLEGNSYFDSLSSTTVSFKVLTEQKYQAVNSTIEVYVNDKLAGTAAGQGVSQASFSPDHKYFAFRIRGSTGCAGACQDTAINVVDLTNPAVMYLLVNPDNSNESTRQFSESGTFIESYVWGDKNITLTAYSIGFTSTQEYYRIHPKEKWSFNLSIPQSIMRNGVTTKLPE